MKVETRIAKDVEGIARAVRNLAEAVGINVEYQIEDKGLITFITQNEDDTLKLFRLLSVVSEVLDFGYDDFVACFEDNIKLKVKFFNLVFKPFE